MFKVGDRVVALKNFGYEGDGLVGQVGTVFVTNHYGNVGVSWEGFSDGHNTSAPRHTPPDSCWYIEGKYLKLSNIDLENK